MSAGDYLEGAAFFVATLGLTLAGALVLLRRRFPQLVGADRVIAYGILAVTGVLAVHVVPLALGILTRGTPVAMAGVWFAGSLMVQANMGRPSARSQRSEEGDGLAMLLALVATTSVAVFAVAFVLDQLTVASASIDYQNFHMSGVASWIQTSSLWQIDAFLPDVAPGNYPNNGDVVLLAAVLPWHNDFLGHASMSVFAVMTGIAGYALARELGAPRSTAAVAGSLLVTIPVVAVAAFANAMVDSVMLFAFAAGILFLLRHHRTGATSELVLAGLALGISFGTKWYAVSSVAIVIAVWAVTSLLLRRRPRVVVRQSAAIVGLVAVVGGIWLVRNWIESGNPVFPVKVAPLGVTLFDAPPDVVREQAGFTIAHYLGDADAWTDFILPQYKRALAAPAALLGVGFAIAIGLLLVRGASALARRAVLIACAVAAVLVAIAYSVTPYTAGGPDGSPVLVGADSRYLIPALVIAAPLAGWAAGAIRRGPAVFAALGFAAIAHGVRWAAHGGLSGASVDGVYFAAGVAIVALLALAVWAWVRRSHRPERARPLALGVVGVCAVAVVAGGYVVQERFNDERYRGADPAIDWVIERADAGQRIGLAGVWSDAGISPVLPAFGPRFENYVAYIGPLVREMRRRYTSRDGYGTALVSGDYDFVIVGRGRPGLPPAPEGRWTRRAGYELLTRSARLDLYGRGA